MTCELAALLLLAMGGAGADEPARPPAPLAGPPLRIATPAPALPKPLAATLARLADAERVAEDTGRVEEAFFSAYRRLLARFVAREPDAVRTAAAAEGAGAAGDAGEAVCRDASAARALADARRALVEYRAASARLERAARGVAWSGPPESLTPSTRRRLDQMRAAPGRAAQTLALMQALDAGQLARELGARGCDVQELERLGASLPPDELAPAPLPASGDAPAPTADIHVDNAHCDGAFEVIVDGRAIGEAAPRATTVLAAPEGWRRLCLAPKGEGRACANADRHAVVFLHQGWSVRPHCE